MYIPKQKHETKVSIIASSFSNFYTAFHLKLKTSKYCKNMEMNLKAIQNF